MGRITGVSVVSGVYHFAADVPEGPTRSQQYLEEYDAGIRGTFSLGWRITDLESAGRDPSGQPKFDAGWELTEISDEGVPADPDAVADLRTEQGLVRLSNGGWIPQEPGRDTRGRRRPHQSGRPDSTMGFPGRRGLRHVCRAG